MPIKKIKEKNVWSYIKFFSLVFSIPISIVSVFVMVFIIWNDSADSISSWVSAGASFISAIATIGVGVFAYKIAQKQNDSGQIGALIDVSRYFSDSINSNFNSMVGASSQSVANMGFPSNYIGDYIQMGEIIKNVSSDTTAGTSKIVFKSLVSPMAWNELETGKLLWHFIDYELTYRNLDFSSLNDGEKNIFFTVYNQYRKYQEIFSNLINLENREFWNKIEEKLKITY
ncbi:hypothetical protein J4P41_07305 [Gluconobacter sp. NFX36]|uniref:hypothetical protein n=1 Tax=Gluconobacter sp. NFX36 TaxID=2819535 RepID=UPI003CEC4E7B